nr:retrovirus-related Pol polyprotein from transposon TNT 1-94 [Tanacetum cinerariifolium]
MSSPPPYLHHGEVGDIELHFIPTQYQLADIFTKPLDKPTFKRLIVEVGYSGEIKAKGTLKMVFFLLGANPSVFVDKTKFARDGLKTSHTITGSNKDNNNAKKEASFDQDEFNTSLGFSSFHDATKEIKLEDLSKLVKDMDVDFIDLDSLDDDGPIMFKMKRRKNKVMLKRSMLKNIQKLKTLHYLHLQRLLGFKS